MIEKRKPDVLTISTTFYYPIVSRDFFSKAEMRQFSKAGNEWLPNKPFEKKSRGSIEILICG